MNYNYRYLYETGNSQKCFDEWNEYLKNSPLTKRTIRTEEEIIKRWDKAAKWFAMGALSKESRERREKTINILKSEGALTSNMNILDVGAGPGEYSIMLSEHAKKVIAIEPSCVMAQILENNTKKRNAENIDIIRKPWQNIDINEKGWENTFDLVFASMSPGIIKPHEFLKFIKSSRKWCFVAAASSIHYGQAFKDLWKIFFDEELSLEVFDIIFPFNLVYSMGYRPKMWFNEIIIEKSFDIESAVNYLMGFMWQYIDEDSESMDIIKKYVESKAVNGVYNYKRVFGQGMMYWSV